MLWTFINVKFEDISDDSFTRAGRKLLDELGWVQASFASLPGRNLALVPYFEVPWSF